MHAACFVFFCRVSGIGLGLQKKKLKMVHGVSECFIFFIAEEKIEGIHKLFFFLGEGNLALNRSGCTYIIYHTIRILFFSSLRIF